jgi:broad specificity phosphatase PhoE
MIPKKFEVIRLKRCESWNMVQAAHNTGLSTIYDKGTEGTIMIVTSNGSVTGLIK